MPIWPKNATDPERRKATLFVFQADGVTPADKDTDFSTGNKYRTSGTEYGAALGTMVNVGIDGEWEYTGDPTEADVDASEGIIMIPAQTIDGVDYAVSRAIVKLGSPVVARNESNPFKRMATVFIFEDDGVTPADKTTDFSTGNLLRASGISYVDAGGTMVNAGIDGEWDYGFTQPETNQDASELLVMVPAQTIGPTSFGQSKSIVTLGAAASPPTPQPPSPTPVPSPYPTTSPQYVDVVELGISRLISQFQTSSDM